MEIWIPVYDNAENYEVSNYGQIKKIFKKSKRLLIPRKSKDGYLFLELRKNKKKYTKKVHRIVAESFLGKFDSMCVNHIDGDKLNNSINNLEWISTRENCVHRSLMKYKSSKYPNITWDKDRRKWRAQVYIEKKQIYIGIFDDEEIAYKKLCLFLHNKGIQNKYL